MGGEMSETPERRTSLFSELRRRRVFRVIGVYAVVAFVVVQVANNFFPVLHLPDWTTTFVAALAVLGFPLAVVLAWAFELTPEGVRRAEPSPHFSRFLGPGSTTAGGWLLAGGGLVVLAGVAGLLWRSGPSPGGGPDIRVVAVLPFDDMSPTRDLAHIGEGVAEEILNTLANIGGLQVLARTSSFRMREHVTDLRDFHTRFGVEAVLEGSVRRDGDRLRFTAQLIGTRDNFHIWSANFDGPTEELFRVQEEVARGVAQALGVPLAPRDPGQAGRSDARSEAYELYLRGRLFLNQRTPEGLRTSIEYLSRAMELDSTYAPALSAMADAYAVAFENTGGESAEELPLETARRLAERALDLDPLLGEAHASLGLVHFFLGNWRAADASLRTAVALNPGYAHGLVWWAIMALGGHGDLPRALALTERAYTVDPLSVAPAGWYAITLVYSGEAGRGVEVMEANTRFNPDSGFTFLVLAIAYAAAGRGPEAASATARASELVRGHLGVSMHLAFAQAMIGDLQGPRALRAEAEERGAPSHLVAQIDAALGDFDRAFEGFHRALEQEELAAEGLNLRATLEFHPAFSAFRADPRFPELLERIRRELDLE
jgi:adenylate cyclase